MCRCTAKRLCARGTNIPLGGLCRQLCLLSVVLSFHRATVPPTHVKINNHQQAERGNNHSHHQRRKHLSLIGPNRILVFPADAKCNAGPQMPGLGQKQLVASAVCHMEIRYGRIPLVFPDPPVDPKGARMRPSVRMCWYLLAPNSGCTLLQEREPSTVPARKDLHRCPVIPESGFGELPG